ncbi:amidohydrolase family protein [Roseomonas marmotae]|uniref:Amidohydrolase n=1 Tax=Roseomonas marmotae TaxID=2768161 RepID=A0ABS3KDB8_9PROT|nr:amidohydrolase family protein [Roseomonas marmotae]MBO1075458.1 amidohydrolase [Roseomonas marmotae]QTI81408.1 amidohydrolase [Roseomonas marmotae]
MNAMTAGAIDCDIHPAVPGPAALLPYLPPQWRDMVVQRGVHDLETITYPRNSPLTARPDWRLPEGRKPGSDLGQLRAQALDGFGLRLAICNCLYGVQVLFSEDMAAAYATAVNDWLAAEWLDQEPRLRASILVPVQNPEMAAAEIERRAADRRFVQVLLPAQGDVPLGRRSLWPIYAAAERHGLPIGIHAGGSYRHPITPVGWPSYHTEDYVDQAQGMQTQLTSLVCEGVFSKFPALRVVMIESGFTWLPAFLWRLEKYWRGLRMEIPWVDRSPSAIIREQARFTLQPVDGPPEAADLLKVIEHMGSEELLLFSTDYPHWQFDGNAALPATLPPELIRRITVENPLATYPRLREAIAS